jgi:ABC-type uncharacterized transport system substrate-binding protein
VFDQEREHQTCDLIVLLVEGEMAGLEQMYFSIRQIALVRLCSRGDKRGIVISYGPDYVDQFRRAAGYVDRILKGDKPSDMPVQAPTKYELIINLKTAKTLGLTVSPALLARADEVIE